MFHCSTRFYIVFLAKLSNREQPDRMSDKKERTPMSQYFNPDLGSDIASPFARDEIDQLIRRSYWLDMSDRSVVMALVQGIGENLSNDQKRAHLADIRRDHLVDEVCPQEILPPER
jgi:hypothetical protein